VEHASFELSASMQSEGFAVVNRPVLEPIVVRHSERIEILERMSIVMCSTRVKH
jgi:hypothetical protein